MSAGGPPSPFAGSLYFPCTGRSLSVSRLVASGELSAARAAVVGSRLTSSLVVGAAQLATAFARPFVDERASRRYWYRNC